MFDKDPLKFEIAIEKGYKTWASTYITMQGYHVEGKGQLDIDLRNYLIRKSKKADR